MKRARISNQFRPTQATIDLAALRYNYQLASRLAGSAQVLAVVKANAYGHGAVKVTNALAAEGAKLFGVASPEEGMELREAGIASTILVLGGPFGASGDQLAQYQLTPVLYELAQLEAIAAQLTQPLSVQVKVDTGMTRLGVSPAALPVFLRGLAKKSKLTLTGILTHLASADQSSLGQTQTQYETFASCEEVVRRETKDIPIFHIANSAALLEGKVGDCQWVRPGLMLYGASPNPRFKAAKELKPVMNFTSEIVSIKKVPAGTAVSYGATWVAARESRIAILPVGYADGYLRSLSNKGKVLINGKEAPVVGRVCMDLTMIDVTDFPELDLGTLVTLWGPEHRVEKVAEQAGTISYELLCALSRRVPRIYDNGAGA